MKDALKRGLVQSSQKFYRLPFHTGKVSARKSDGWFNLTQILTQAELGLKPTAELHKSNRGRYRFVREYGHGGTYVSGQSALDCCEEHGLEDAQLLITDFACHHRWAMENLNAKQIHFLELVNTFGQTRVVGPMP